MGWGSVAFFRERLAVAEEGAGSSSSSMGKEEGTLSEGGAWSPFLDFFMGGEESSVEAAAAEEGRVVERLFGRDMKYREGEVESRGRRRRWLVPI